VAYKVPPKIRSK